MSTPNVEMYPGLAYYAYAAVIIGAHVGERGLDIARANTLAGLFWAQTGFITIASDWTRSASNLIFEELHHLPAVDITVPDEIYGILPRDPSEDHSRVDLTLLTYWSLRHIENDILIERDRLFDHSSRTSPLNVSELGLYHQINGKDVRLPSRLVVSGLESSITFRGHLDLATVESCFGCLCKIPNDFQLLAPPLTDLESVERTYVWTQVMDWRKSLPLHLQ